MARNTKKKQINNALLNAISFLSLCQKTAGNEMQTYCTLADNKAVAFNGVVAMGQTIFEDLEICPHTEQLLAALAECGENFALTELSVQKLSVRSGEFQAFIPCCDREKLPQALPDTPVMAIGEALTDALKIVAPVASEKAATVVQSSIQIANGSALATNRIVVLEAWHGYQLPDMLIPKQAAAAIIKSGKKLFQFGYSGKTATFWFEDGSWIRTQLFQDGRKDLQSLLNQPEVNRTALPKEFFEAVKKISAFGSSVYCRQDKISSERYPETSQTGSQLTIDLVGCPLNVAYSIDNLKYLEKYGTEVDWNYEHFTLFFGSKVRGAIWHERIHQPDATKYLNGICEHGIKELDCNVCIPF